MRLPEGHKVTATVGYDSGGYYVEWFADDWMGDGYGENPLVQHRYGPEHVCRIVAASGHPVDGWHRPVYEDGPDRTDPGYWADNF